MYLIKVCVIIIDTGKKSMFLMCFISFLYIHIMILKYMDIILWTMSFINENTEIVYVIVYAGIFNRV